MKAPIIFLLTTLIAVLVGCSDKEYANDDPSGDTESDFDTDTGLDFGDAEIVKTPVDAIPFDYLNCEAAPPTADDPPEGGSVISSGNRTVWAKIDPTFTCIFEDIPVEGQDFDTSKRATVTGTAENIWWAQVQDKSIEPLATGDILLTDVWARCEKTLAESNECKMLFIIENPEYAKMIEYPITVGKDWTHFYIPLASTMDLPAGDAAISLFVGYADQSVDVGPLEVINYGTSQTLDSLPSTSVSYPGIDGDAPWREDAATRIDEIRRGDMLIEVQDADGNPVEGAEVKVTLNNHAFLFGTAIKSGIITGVEDVANRGRYVEELPRLFNVLTPENAFKWKPWAGDWGTAWDMDRALDTLTWIEEQNIPARGHVMVWPSWRHLPLELEALAEDPDALRQAVNDHIAEAGAAVKGRLLHWDVVNEPFDNHDLMDILGKEEMASWFELAREADPDALLFLNDYAILTGGSGDTGHRDDFEAWLQLLADLDAPVDGIGLQSHFGLALTGPEDVFALLERYGTSFDKEIAITEYDINVQDENLAGCYTHDFMNTIFSHEKVSTFVMWGFFGDNEPLFDGQWNQKTAGKVYEDLLFSRWKTDETATSNDEGKAGVRGFYGTYDITVTAGDTTAAQTLVHTADAPGNITVILQ